jgi:hypothetical protein
LPSARDADALACGAQVQMRGPGQPVRAGQEPVAPAAASVELAKQVQQPGSGDVDACGQHHDVVAQALQRSVSEVSNERISMRVSFWDDSNPRFSTTLGGDLRGDQDGNGFFRDASREAAATGCHGPLDGI